MMSASARAASEKSVVTSSNPFPTVDDGDWFFGAEGGVKVDSALDLMAKKPGEVAAQDEGKVEEAVTKYTVADPELVAAREEMAKYSTKRARARLARERSRREAAKRRGEENNINANGKRPLGKTNVVEPDSAEANGPSTEEGQEEDILTKLDRECLQLYKSVRNMCLEGSQFADARPLSAICTSPPAPGYAMDSRGDPPALIAAWAKSNGNHCGRGVPA